MVNRATRCEWQLSATRPADQGSASAALFLGSQRITSSRTSIGFGMIYQVIAHLGVRLVNNDDDDDDNDDDDDDDDNDDNDVEQHISP